MEQADNFIIDITMTDYSEADLIRQIENVFNSTHTKSINTVIVVRNNEVKGVYKRATKKSDTPPYAENGAKWGQRSLLNIIIPQIQINASVFSKKEKKKWNKELFRDYSKSRKVNMEPRTTVTSFVIAATEALSYKPVKER